MSKTINVLSVQMPMIGHNTYGTLLRRGFAGSPDITFESHWTTDDLEFHARAANRILWQDVPIPAVYERNLDIKRFRSDLGISYMSRRLIERTLKRRQPDALHFHTQNTAWLSRRYMRRIPTVITTDQTNVQIAREYPAWTRWTHRPSIATERHALACAGAIVVFSQWGADSFINEYGISAHKVHVVPIGVDLEGFARFIPRRAESPDVKRLLFVGGEFRRKGGPLLVDVFREKFAHRNVELHLVTNDPAATAGPKIFVHRKVTPLSPAWYELYSRADVFVLPTLREAFGIVYIEAMAAGLPVIGTRVGAGPEIVTQDVGFVIEPNDPQALAQRIAQLLDDAELRQRLGERARIRARTVFDVKRHVTRLGDIFRAVVAEHGGQAPEVG